MNVSIRMAERQDFPSILLLIKEFSYFQKSQEKVTITLEQLYEEQNYFHCVVAENDNRELIGFATFFFAYYSWSGKAIYLDDLYVTRVSRNKGAGKMLLDKVIMIARQHSCKKVRWQVSKWNKNAIDFYTKMGAKTNDVEINCDLKI